MDPNPAGRALPHQERSKRVSRSDPALAGSPLCGHPGQKRKREGALRKPNREKIPPCPRNHPAGIMGLFRGRHSAASLIAAHRQTEAGGETTGEIICRLSVKKGADRFPSWQVERRFHFLSYFFLFSSSPAAFPNLRNRLRQLRLFRRRKMDSPFPFRKGGASPSRKTPFFWPSFKPAGFLPFA